MDTFFKLLNAFPMPLWLLMMFAPRATVTQRLSRSSIVFGLAACHYVAALGLAARGGSRDGGGLDFTSLDGIRKGFSTREGTLAAWSHMLALDLFTGAWIYRRCMALGAPAWVRVPALFFTLMTGPLGLLLFLLWRGLVAQQSEALLAES